MTTPETQLPTALPWWSWLLVFCAAALAYQPALRNTLTFDDIVQVLEFDAPTTPAGWADAALEPWVPGARLKNHWRPAARLTILAQKGIGASLGSNSLWPLYAFNIALHGAVALLLLALARELRFSPQAAVLGALIFATHPLHAEPVQQIVGRAELFAALFMLAGVLAFRRWGMTRHGWWQQPVCFFLALCSKEHAAIYPVLIALAGATAWPIREKYYRRHLAAEFVLMIGALALFLLIRASVAGPLVAPESVTVSENPMAALSRGERVPIALGALGLGMGHFIWPVNIPPDFSAISFPVELGWRWPWAWAGAAVLALAAAYIYLNWKRGGIGWALAAGGLCAWFITSSLPFINGAMAARRWWYFPALALSLAAGRILGRALADPRIQSRRLAAPLMAGTLTVLLMMANWRDSLAWRSLVDHAEATLAHYPDNWRSLATLSYQAFQDEQYEKGEALARRATEIFPENAKGWLFAGQNAMMLPGGAAEAEAAFRRTLRLDPRLISAQRNLATVLEMQGRTSEAAQVRQGEFAGPAGRP